MNENTVKSWVIHFPLSQRGAEGDLATSPIPSPVKSPLTPFAKGGKPRWSVSP